MFRVIYLLFCMVYAIILATAVVIETTPRNEYQVLPTRWFDVRYKTTISVFVDDGFSTKYGVNAANANIKLKNIRQAIQNIFSVSKLIWSTQLGVDLNIGYIQIGTPSSQYPLNSNPSKGTCVTNDPIILQSHFYNYLVFTGHNKSAYSVFITSCLSARAAGAAYIGGFCNTLDGNHVGSAVTIDNPLVFAHELGHAFGARHSFENGVGGTGCIMDYGNPYYNGSIQFRPERRSEITRFMDNVMSRCKFVAMIASSPSPNICGDGILAPDEECECPANNKLQYGNTNCGGVDGVSSYKCINCKITWSGESHPKKFECSSAFATRQSWDHPGAYKEVNTKKSLADKRCCNDIITPNHVSVKQMCDLYLGYDIITTFYKDAGMCGKSGFCYSLCNQGSYIACKMPRNSDPTGCLQACKVTATQCAWSYGDLFGPPGSQWNALPNDSPCWFNGNSKQRGVCRGGRCVYTSARPTLRPTKRPT